MKSINAVSMIAGALIAWSTAPAFAARVARIDIPDTYLREGPGAEYKIVAKLARGARIAASNLPTDGYFKVRTGDGDVGFVPANALFLPDERAPSRGIASEGASEGHSEEELETEGRSDPTAIGHARDKSASGDNRRKQPREMMAPVFRRAGR